MEINYSIEGLSNPSTKIELIGSVFFMRNPIDRNYKIVSAIIKNGDLHMEFEPRDRSYASIIDNRHYIKLKPDRSSNVGLRIKTVEEIDDDLVTVTMYIVESVYCADGLVQFIFHKWVSNTTRAFADHINLNCDEEGLLLSGFKCVKDYDSITPLDWQTIFSIK